MQGVPRTTHAQSAHPSECSFKRCAAVQEAWNLANDSLRVPICVRFQSLTIACACIHLAARRVRFAMPEAPPWWTVLGVELADMEAIALEIQLLYTLPRPVYISVNKGETAASVDAARAAAAATSGSERGDDDARSQQTGDEGRARGSERSGAERAGGGSPFSAADAEGQSARDGAKSTRTPPGWKGGTRVRESDGGEAGVRSGRSDAQRDAFANGGRAEHNGEPRKLDEQRGSRRRDRERDAGASTDTVRRSDALAADHDSRSSTRAQSERESSDASKRSAGSVAVERARKVEAALRGSSRDANGAAQRERGVRDGRPASSRHPPGAANRHDRDSPASLDRSSNDAGSGASRHQAAATGRPGPGREDSRTGRPGSDRDGGLPGPPPGGPGISARPSPRSGTAADEPARPRSRQDAERSTREGDAPPPGPPPRPAKRPDRHASPAAQAASAAKRGPDGLRRALSPRAGPRPAKRQHAEPRRDITDRLTRPDPDVTPRDSPAAARPSSAGGSFGQGSGRSRAEARGSPGALLRPGERGGGERGDWKREGSDEELESLRALVQKRERVAASARRL